MQYLYLLEILIRAPEIAVSTILLILIILAILGWRSYKLVRKQIDAYDDDDDDNDQHLVITT